MSDFTVKDDRADRLGLQYEYDHPFRYDGISEWWTPEGRFGRWCGKQLFGNEVEPPFCKGEVHPQHWYDDE